MTYNQIIKFGDSGNEVVFLAGNITVSHIISTLKTNMGKGYISKPIPFRNAQDDKIISMEGLITGQDRNSSQSFEDRIQQVRTLLETYNDGYKYSYEDGQTTIDAVIQKGTLIFNDEPREDNMPIRFNVVFEQWQ